MDFLFGKNIQVGLDVGNDMLKWAAVDRRKGLCYVWQAPLFPERSAQKDRPAEDQLRKSMADLIKQCKAANGKTWNKTVTCPVYGQGVIHGYIESDVRTQKDLKFAVTSTLLKDLPYALEDFELNCLSVPPLTEAHPMAAFYAVVPRETIELARSRVEACGLKLGGVVASPIALAREFGHNRPDDPEFWALVHSGFEWTQVIVVRGTHPYYVREIPVAGGSFTYAFQMGEQVSWQVAEQNKRAYDCYESREHFTEPFVRRFLDEVKKSLDHFKGKYGKPVSKVAFSGGSACWRGLAKRLGEHLKTEVMLDGWRQIRPDQPRPEDEALLHKVSLGLALE